MQQSFIEFGRVGLVVRLDSCTSFLNGINWSQMGFFFNLEMDYLMVTMKSSVNPVLRHILIEELMFATNMWSNRMI